MHADLLHVVDARHAPPLALSCRRSGPREAAPRTQGTNNSEPPAAVNPPGVNHFMADAHSHRVTTISHKRPMPIGTYRRCAFMKS